MSLFSNEYRSTYRKSAFSKQEEYYLLRSVNSIIFNGKLYGSNSIVSEKILLDNIVELSVYKNSILITYVVSTIYGNREKRMQALIGLDDEDAKMILSELNHSIEEYKNIREIQIENSKQLEKEHNKRIEEIRKFYDECYSFHLSNNSEGHFVINEGEYRIQAIYIDKENGINFLYIDAGTKKEINANIPFEHIHYYEKAGSIHYKNDIKTQVSSFGGSYTGSTFSKGATILGGVLMGTMGLFAGAMLSRKPTQFTFPKQEIEIGTSINSIDDRSIILNYYSDKNKQYMDMELPADSFNFLQTYLPSKKFDIVMQNEIDKYTSLNNKELTENNKIPLSDFEEKVNKLKLLRDNNIISNEEYEKEKTKLIKLI